MEAISKVSRKGWVVIPAAIRKKFGLSHGSLLKVKIEGNKIVLIPKRNPVEECFGKLASDGSLTKLLLKERKKDRIREEEKVCL